MNREEVFEQVKSLNNRLVKDIRAFVGKDFSTDELWAFATSQIVEAEGVKKRYLNTFYCAFVPLARLTRRAELYPLAVTALMTGYNLVKEHINMDGTDAGWDAYTKAMGNKAKETLPGKEITLYGGKETVVSDRMIQILFDSCLIATTYYMELITKEKEEAA